MSHGCIIACMSHGSWVISHGCIIACMSHGCIIACLHKHRRLEGGVV